ncbi:hypothetical protein C2G38_2047476 [Gigaspora rosea]|uniref:Uncharacterized protein n=1 Tax=Gigaspora rosea TaxID=44941 RepID=A0A397U5P2_9GLOM|nr:hypothetical protein C2G38_2047476 [Gigaspora rosea]
MNLMLWYMDGGRDKDENVGKGRGMTGNGKADEKNDFNIDNGKKKGVNKYDIPIIEVKNNNEVFYYSRKSVRNACDDPEDGNNREKASDGRARIVSNEMGNGKGICDEKKKFKYRH